MQPLLQSRFYRESVTEASTTRPVPGERAGCVHALAAGNRYLFNFHPAAHTHAQKTDSARKRAKRKTAVAGGGLQRRKLGYPGFYCQGGEGCISSVREDWRLGKLPCFFLCRGTAPGRGGPPWQAAVRRRFRSWLLGWGVFHEEEGGVCPLLVSIKQ